MSEKTHWKKMFNYAYLGAQDLQKGVDLVGTITAVKVEQVKGTGGKSEDCSVIHWKESIKPMIMNRTNAKAITKALDTPYVEEWEGGKVSIYIQTGIQAFGTTTDGLRIRDKKVSSKPTKASLRTEIGNALKLVEDQSAVDMQIDELKATKEAKEDTLEYYQAVLETLYATLNAQNSKKDDQAA